MRDERAVRLGRSIENSRANGATAATRVEFQRDEVSQERRLQLYAVARVDAAYNRLARKYSGLCILIRHTDLLTKEIYLISFLIPCYLILTYIGEYKKIY